MVESQRGQVCLWMDIKYDRVRFFIFWYLFMSRAQRILYEIARKYGDYRLQEIADMFGLRHYGGVSSTIHLFMKELQHDPDLREKVSCVLKKLRAQI